MQPTAMVVGPTTGPMRISPSGTVDVVGIRFEPLGARPALRVRADELTNRTLPLEDLAPDAAREWPERLHETAAWSGRVILLERWLQAWLDEARSDAVVERATWMIARSDGRVSVDELSRRLTVTPRRLERKFLAQVGIPAKKLCRITRFQRVLGELRRGDVGLAASAIRFGYSDQPHLTREFRDFTGQTPAAFLGGSDLLPRLFAGLET